MNVTQKPNILITGTPGVGKSTLCKKLAKKTGLVWQDISKIAKDQNCIQEYDEVYETSVLDEDKLLDFLEDEISPGGNIVDYHGCDFFPERWFDVVFVLRADNTNLYDRLIARGYEGKKLEDNIQCEIFQTILEEAQSSYNSEIVHELQNNSEQELHQNIKQIVKWITKWKKDKIQKSE
ncbi:adenylate kinase isoenzyme 6 [Arctopsyche grandis]|uniref:adenylate kinase isoenzyme 6 n=1 Tax=Arctopsyche grandis TaxID=121162 RepID=UPI00406D8A0C